MYLHGPDGLSGKKALKRRLRASQAELEATRAALLQAAGRQVAPAPDPFLDTAPAPAAPAMLAPVTSTPAAPPVLAPMEPEPLAAGFAGGINWKMLGGLVAAAFALRWFMRRAR